MVSLFYEVFFMRKAKLFVINGITAAGVALLLRFTQMAFNVYLSGALGAVGMGAVSLVGSVYAPALTLALSGIQLTCTRLCAEALEQRNGKRAKKSLYGCLLYSIFFGLLSAALLYLSAPLIAEKILHAPEAEGLLKILAPSLPAAALSSCLVGYFTAVRRVSRTALSALLCQGVKIGLTVYLITLFGAEGRGVFALFAATCLSEIAGTALLLLMLLVEGKKDLANTGRDANDVNRRILSIAAPLAVAAWIRSFLVSAEHVLIPKGLMKYGAGSTQALATYGRMHGMALPVIFFPTAILTAFTSLLIPEISRFHAENKKKEIGATASRMLRMTLLFSLAFGMLMLFFGKELGIALYDCSETGKLVALFAPLVPVMYLDTATDAILKGLDEQVYCMKINILDAALSLLMVFFLVPRMGAAGYVLTVFLSECFNTLFSLWRLCKRTELSLPPLRCLILPLFSALLAAGGAKSVLTLFGTLSVLPSLLLGCTLFLALYTLLLRLTGSFDKADRRYFGKLLPLGAKS